MRGLLLCTLATGVSTFSVVSHHNRRCRTAITAGNDNEKLPPSNMDRLREEAANPFRTFRIFVYGAAGANAAIGGLTSLAQLAGTVSDAPSALPLEQVTQNLGVDFGVVAAAAFLFSLDKAGQESQVAEYATQDLAKEKKENSKLSKDAMAAREEELKGLSIEVVVGQQRGDTSSKGSGDPRVETRRATVREIQEGAKQHVVIVAGTTSVLKEALLRAMILGDRFSKQSILIVPVTLGGEGGGGSGSELGGGGGGSGTRGFGRSAWDGKPYVAKAVDSTDDAGSSPWADYVDSELSAAAAQIDSSAEELASQGIVIVLNREGKIVRRGLGAPEWELVINEDLKDKSKEVTNK